MTENIDESGNCFKVELINPKITDLCINNILMDFGFTRELSFKLSFVLEEVLANIIKYSSYSGKIVINFEELNNRITLEIIDDGNHFNPINSPEPDLNENLKERKESGLGLFLSKTYADNIGYQRKGGKYNIIHLSFRNDTPVKNFKKLKQPIEQQFSGKLK